MILKPPKGAMLNRGSNYARGLVGCWLMNEGGGTIVNDLSGNGNTGSLIADTHFVGGKFGPALDFDGTGDYVTVLDSPELRFDSASQDFSIFAWVKGGGAAVDVIVDKRDANNDGWRLTFASGAVWLSVDGADCKTSSSTINDGTWHFVGGSIVRSGNGQMYLDGIANGAAENVSGQGAMQTTSQVTFGTTSYSVTTDVLTGQIDHVMIYNRALSASEILNLYRSPFCMFEVDL